MWMDAREKESVPLPNHFQIQVLRPTKDLTLTKKRKGSGTPMKHRRTHIPRFLVMLVGHF